MIRAVEILNELTAYTGEQFKSPKLIPLDPRIKKLVEMNFVACKSLIVHSEEESDYKYTIEENGDFIIRFNNTVILLTPRNCMRIDGLQNFGRFSNLSADSYFRIEKLCNKLLDDLYDKFWSDKNLHG